MNWDDKNKVAQCSKIVVTVSNWHFNRDHLKDEKAPVCELKNIMITLKLSSTIFETNGAAPAAAAESIPEGPEKSNSDSPLAASPGTAAANAGGTVTSRTGEHYFFDRNGAIIPYSAFLALIDSEDFQNYLAKVKDVYTQSCRCFDTPPKVNAVPEANKDDNDDDDDDDEVSFIDEKKISRKRRSDFVRTMRNGKAKKILHYNDDTDSDKSRDGTPPPGTGDLTPLPSSSEDEKDNVEETGGADCSQSEVVGEEEEKSSEKKIPENKNIKKKKSRHL